MDSFQFRGPVAEPRSSRAAPGSSSSSSAGGAGCSVGGEGGGRGGGGVGLPLEAAGHRRGPKPCSLHSASIARSDGDGPDGGTREDGIA